MKRFVAPTLAFFALLATACNDGGVVGAPAEETPEPEPTETPAATPTPVPTPPLPEEADLAVTVFWDDAGLDWELHLVKPGGQINDSVNLTDCTWTTCISSSPDWGVIGDAFDDPHKDIDDVDTQGPERIWMANPENGTFTVMVEHWGSGSAESDGYVTILAGGVEHMVEMQNLASHHVWTVATIEMPAGTVTTSTETYDCNASWAGGCTAAIP